MLLRCPVCNEPLIEEAHRFYCKKGHSFDRSKNGYVNLLPPSGHGKHGDSKEMIRARTQFLESGAYQPLSDKINEVSLRHLNSCPHPVIVDAGCGEGYYLQRLLQNIPASDTAEVYGIDISKEAILALSKKFRGAYAIVASTSSIPLSDHCAHLLMNIFSPVFPNEFNRILHPEGKLLRVIPLPMHLYELKSLVYDHAYENDYESEELPGFDLLESHDITYPFTVSSESELFSLFQMTPYYYRTSMEDLRKLEHISSLTITASFQIRIFAPQKSSDPPLS